MTDASPEPASASAPRRIRPDIVWDRARDDYLAGATAEEVCRRHDLGLSAFKVRARQGGWRRTDQPAPDPVEDDIDLDSPAEPRSRMLDKAWRRVSHALDTGRSTEAMRWMRVHAMLLAAERSEARERDWNSAEEMRAITRTARGIEAQGHLDDPPDPGRKSASKAASAHSALEKTRSRGIHPTRPRRARPQPRRATTTAQISRQRSLRRCWGPLGARACRSAVFTVPRPSPPLSKAPAGRWWSRWPRTQWADPSRPAASDGSDRAGRPPRHPA